ncbi:HD domain-containing phosphohydrolase [Herpetosiphon llansteffanensis]|uniref:HD domain-containing phosphohydrolase n=1 Tax=Herpetosiphon llansteffanensis TaxID=2094568 RepID=UPI000D7CC3B4|nr:HD domain-containing phosphohydrolase [Herpetosiphon llansteffanensis]
MNSAATILIIDDLAVARASMNAVLQGEGYELVFAENGITGIAKALELLPDTILLDVMMPDMDGFEVCRQIRANPLLAEIPVVMVTALDDRESRLQGLRAGADDFLSKPIDSLEIKTRLQTITRLNRYRRLQDERRQVERLNQEIIDAYNAGIEAWSRALDLRDKETEGHSKRVTEMTVRIAEALGITGDDLVQIWRGALLHDIGKMGIPDAILHKPGPLTNEEWLVMQKHPTYAYDLLRPIHYLQPALDIPYCHHEKWDGSGYPRGLKGTEIPLAARIFALADVWDALRSDRPYRLGWPVERIREHIANLAGSHFDPALVPLFLQFVEEASEPLLLQQYAPATLR